MSEKPKWTPGPWAHEPNKMHHIWWVLANGANGKTVHVAEVLGILREADARLIAAAPELYEALENLLLKAGHTTDPQACENAYLALAKARGEVKP